MAEMTGGDAVYYALRALGVDCVFGIVSVHNIPVYDAIARRGNMRTISVRHEQGAVHAADGYARATGKLGVAITSTGPGTVNGMIGLYEAAYASSPVLMVTGQVESRYYGQGKGFIHEAEKQVPMLQTVTRRTESVRRVEDITGAVIAAGRDALTGRPQPAAVEIPIDLQYARADIEIPGMVGPGGVVRPDEGLISEAARVLGKAGRPIIWAGGGVVSADASAELIALAESLQAPVVTTISGRGAIPEDHPLCLGPLSNYPRVREIIAEAEAVLAVGTRFQMGPTARWTLRIPGTLIHVDADPAVIGRAYPPAIGIVGDARLGLAGIRSRLQDGGSDPRFLERAQAARDETRRQIWDQIGPDYAAIMDVLRESLPRDSIIVRDTTVAAQLWGNRIFPIFAPRTSMQPASAAIGPALPLAIGAALATGKRTLVIQGDGGLMLNLGELATAAQYRVPLTICVFNDGGYGVIRVIQAQMFEGRQTGVDLTTPDFVALGRSVGLHSQRVSSIEGLRKALQTPELAAGPLLLDIDMSAFRPMHWHGGIPVVREERQRPQSAGGGD